MRTIRTMTNEKGETFFVGKDVAKALGYDQTDKAIQRHVEEDDRMKCTVTDKLGRAQRTVIINESGLYALVLSSKLPKAKKFKRWVTSEVLPQIRMTGGYIPTHDAEGRQLTDAEIVDRAHEIIGLSVICLEVDGLATAGHADSRNERCATSTRSSRIFRFLFCPYSIASRKWRVTPNERSANVCQKFSYCS